MTSSTRSIRASTAALLGGVLGTMSTPAEIRNTRSIASIAENGYLGLRNEKRSNNRILKSSNFTHFSFRLSVRFAEVKELKTIIGRRGICLEMTQTVGHSRSCVRHAINGGTILLPRTPTVLARHNMALNLAPFGRWTLRDKAAQRRLALRWASQSYGYLAPCFWNAVPYATLTITMENNNG